MTRTSRAAVALASLAAWTALACAPGRTGAPAQGAAPSPAPDSAPALGAAPSPAPDSAPAWRAQGRRAVADARALTGSRGSRARNAILFIGDGMGISTVTAARILQGQLRDEPGEENRLAFERLPHVALLKTYNTNQQVPDSAGTATAMLTGVKTRAGVINLDASAPRGVAGRPTQRLRTLFEMAEARGLATGLVTTARLTHATPAAAYAHTAERGWESDATLPADAAAAGARDIARQLVEFEAGDGFEVALGGGRAQFWPADRIDPEHPEWRGLRADGRDLVAEWQDARPRRHFVWNRDQLAALDPGNGGQLLGLFEPSHMGFELYRSRDRAGEPSLAEMTRAALERLGGHNAGFLLLVEAGRIDHGHHGSRAGLALHETLALSDAVAEALDRVDLGETLVVVTADHSHVFSIGGYPTRGNPILGLARGNDARGEPADAPLRDAHGLPYTTLAYANGPGHPDLADGPRGRPDLSEVDTADPAYVQESAVPLVAETHAGEDVPLYAGGPGAPLFHGVQEQSYVFHALVAALGWDEDAPD